MKRMKRMKLSSRQREYWPDVSAAREVLREIDKASSSSADLFLGDSLVLKEAGGW
jgi:hypothetical protein